MKLDKQEIRKVFTCIGAMVAYLIGSGYATGQEIMQFFTGYGVWGFGSLIISLIIMASCSAIIMQDSYRLGLDSAKKIFTHYCGHWLGTGLALYVPFLLFSIFVIMISGAGATVSEYYGLNPYLGRVVMSVLSGVTAVLGLNKLVRIIGKIGPCIILFTITVGIISFLGRNISISEAAAQVTQQQIPLAAPTWWISGFLYSAFCITTATSFFASMGTQMPSVKSAIASGFMGGGIFILAALVMNIGLLSHIDQLGGKNIPVLYIARQISPVLGVVFSVVLFWGIYTTAVPMLWSTVNLFSRDGTKKARILCVLFTLVAFVCGLLPFDKLVNTLYPLSGYVGTVLIFGILFSQIRTMVKNCKTV